MSHAIAVNDLVVRYGGKLAVDHVSLRIPTGSVYALLGRNGAGKSSLVRCLLGQRRADEGHVEIGGQDVWKQRQRVMERVGVVPEEADAPPQMKVRELEAFCSRVYSNWQRAAFDSRMQRFDISEFARFGDLSKGQKKQVTLALALATSPEVVVLDDPTLGLDVVARKSLFDEVIGEMADRGITTLITTHDLAGIETFADRVGILQNGRLVLDEDMETLKSRFRRIRMSAPAAALGSLGNATVRNWGSGTEAIVSNFDERAFDASHAEVSALSLEEIFIAVTGEGARS